jgi:hypothetical protein
MSANHKRLLALVLWAQAVLTFAYLKWWPRPIDLAGLPKGQAAFVERLPQEGILARMINPGVSVGLAVRDHPAPPEAAQGPSGKQAAASPPAITPVSYTTIVPSAPVLDKICRAEMQLTTRIAVCYAVIAVPMENMPKLSAPADVSIWVVGK